MSNCGCRVRHNPGDQGESHFIIDYCPLHKKAGQMREALKRIRDGDICAEPAEVCAHRAHGYAPCAQNLARAALKKTEEVSRQGEALQCTARFTDNTSAPGEADGHETR